MEQPPWRASPSSARSSPPSAVSAIRCWRRSARPTATRVEGLEHLQAAQALGQPIHAFWHGRILPGTIYFKRRGIVVITSENFDGEWIARIITRFGYGTARGSSSRGARKALLQMVRDVKDTPVAFTLDGPRGPARVAQPGAVWLSKATGNPIIPFHLEANRHWTMKSWDRTQIPKPFATIALVFAPPIQVSSSADDSDVERGQSSARSSACRLREALPGVVMSVVLVTSDRFADHLTPPGHPERVERAETMQVVASRWRQQGGAVTTPREATDEDLLRVHGAAYVESLKKARGRAAMLDPDTFTVAGIRRSRPAGGWRGADGGRSRAGGARAASRGAGPAAGPPCRSERGDGVLPVQQHRGWRGVGARARTRARGHRRLRRPSRQRHAVDVL